MRLHVLRKLCKNRSSFSMAGHKRFSIKVSSKANVLKDTLQNNRQGGWAEGLKTVHPKTKLLLHTFGNSVNILWRIK